MIYFNSQNSTYLSSFTELNPGLQIGFTTKEIGDCRQIDVVQNYFKENNMSNSKLVLLEQIHSTNVAFADNESVSNIQHIKESDAVLTQNKNLILVVRTADCLPVIYYSSKTHWIGAAHIGWRGTLKNLMGKIIDTLYNIGVGKDELFIIIGPAINQCCYEIDIDMYAEFMTIMERFNEIAFKPHGEKFRMNLTRLNYELARESGISRNQIDYFPFCTYCNSDHFFSYRREYKKNPQLFGEMMGFVTLQSI